MNWAITPSLLLVSRAAQSLLAPGDGSFSPVMGNENVQRQCCWSGNGYHAAGKTVVTSWEVRTSLLRECPMLAGILHPLVIHRGFEIRGFLHVPF